jgi:predicted enzyme related to lactoylglutathione lyase
MADGTPLLPGKFVWFEHVSQDAKKAQAFFAEVLGWKSRPFPMGNSSYDMILLGDSADTMIGGYAAPKGNGQAAHWISYLSVEDVDAAAKAAAAQGGRVVEAPYDVPGVGRMARIADPQAAELCLFKSSEGDPADAPKTPQGGWLWNELHTSDAPAALSFYEKVVGFGHRAMDMGPGGIYYILSKGGVDRGGATALLPAGVAPHWLPYVCVNDVDATVARAKKGGATIQMAADDIPGVGRVALLLDPTGAALALLKPMPREKQA